MGRGDYLDATISAIGIIPYLGDVAKGTRINKDIKLIDSSIKASNNTVKDINEESDILYRSFTTRNFRENLIRKTGINPAGKHAHHILPQKYRNEFLKRGINIDDPKYGTWLETQNHLSKAKMYNSEWARFFQLTLMLLKKRLNFLHMN